MISICKIEVFDIFNFVGNVYMNNLWTLGWKYNVNKHSRSLRILHI